MIHDTKILDAETWEAAQAEFREQHQEQQDRQTRMLKPKCPLIGQDGNIYNLMSIASRTLTRNGLVEASQEMWERVTASGSYAEALCVIGEYVDITE